jgi:hypothetical protein
MCDGAARYFVFEFEKVRSEPRRRDCFDETPAAAGVSDIDGDGGGEVMRWSELGPLEPRPARWQVRPFWRLFLTEIYLCDVCSCQEIFRERKTERPARSGRGGRRCGRRQQQRMPAHAHGGQAAAAARQRRRRRLPPPKSAGCAAPSAWMCCTTRCASQAVVRRAPTRPLSPPPPSPPHRVFLFSSSIAHIERGKSVGRNCRSARPVRKYDRGVMENLRGWGPRTGHVFCRVCLTREVPLPWHHHDDHNLESGRTEHRLCFCDADTDASW